MIYYKCDRQWEYWGHYTSIYKNLRIAKFLEILNSTCFKIHKLSKFNVHKKRNELFML
jgi:hypothetical protein